MKSKTAKRLASLVIDDWPLPNWIKNRIARVPQVQSEILAWQEHARLLGKAADELSESEFRESPTIHRSAESIPTRSELGWAIVAIAASILLAVGSWYALRTSASIDDSAVAESASLDLKPVLATFQAGKEIGSGIQRGIHTVGIDFLRAGERLQQGIAQHLLTIQDTQRLRPVNLEN